MPDNQLRKNQNKKQPSGSGRRGSRGSIADAPSDHTRGERKKAALKENPPPIELGD